MLLRPAQKSNISNRWHSELGKRASPCEIVVRPGLAADQILAFLHERDVDRIVMGTHCPGPIGKLLVGSVAEAVLRTANVPVCIIGPDVVDGKYRNFATSTILCAVSLLESSYMVAAFAAELGGTAIMPAWSCSM